MANPTALLRSALLMLRHIGEPEAALKIRNALEKVYRDRDKLTKDVGGKAGTSEFADEVIKAMAAAVALAQFELCTTILSSTQKCGGAPGAEVSAVTRKLLPVISTP